MQSYTVHLADGRRIEDASFVADRWAWLGLAFGPAWLAYHRLWVSAALAVVASVGVGAFGISQGMNPGAASLLSTLVNLAIGFEGNNLRRWKKERKGQHVIAVVTARSEEEAEARFFSQYLGRRAQAARAETGPGTVLPSGLAEAQGRGIIGLFPQPGGRM